MVLVGGAGTIYGPIVAAIVLTVGTEKLNALGNVRYMIVAVLIVLTLQFLPGGFWSLWQRRSPSPAPGRRLGGSVRPQGAHRMSIAWPDGKRAAVSFTFDFDAESVWLAMDPENAPPSGDALRRHLWRPRRRAAHPRDVGPAQTSEATFFVVGRNVELYPDRVAAIVAGGHEIAVHGYTHTPPARLTPVEEEAELIRRANCLRASRRPRVPATAPRPGTSVR